MVKSLSELLEARETHLSNLDNCKSSRTKILTLLKRDGSSSAVASEAAAEHGLEGFDHSRCTDCSIGFTITCDCTTHLAALQKQGQDANDMLQSLVEIREQMTEVAIKLDFASPGPTSPVAGSLSGFHDSNAYPDEDTNGNGYNNPSNTHSSTGAGTDASNASKYDSSTPNDNNQNNSKQSSLSKEDDAETLESSTSSIQLEFPSCDTNASNPSSSAATSSEVANDFNDHHNS